MSAGSGAAGPGLPHPPEDVERELMLDFIRVTETAALRAAHWMGKGDKEGADGAAVDGMRGMLDLVNVRGRVVLGEGEKDKAPMLFNGEEVGRGQPTAPLLDIAVDPLEGTRLVAKGLPNAMSVIVAAEKGSLLPVPSFYMQKIAVGPEAVGHIEIDAPPAHNVRAVAKALGKRVENFTVVILDRPRHEGLIQAVREAGARVKLISDGDVAAAIAPSLDDSGIDMLMGVGGAPEAVLTAVAVRCLGGELQTRLWIPTPEDRERAEQAGFTEPSRVYSHRDLAASNSCIFAATGITDGDLLRGVRYKGSTARTHSVVMRARTRTVRFVETIHHLAYKTLRSRREDRELPV